MLLSFGAYVNHFGDKMWAPVHVACDHGYTGVVTSLIDGAADFETPVEGGVTALYIAAYAGHADIVRLLVRSGAEVRDVSRSVTVWLIPVSNLEANTGRLL